MADGVAADRRSEDLRGATRDESPPARAARTRSRATEKAVSALIDQQHRKNRPPSAPKQEPSAETGP